MTTATAQRVEFIEKVQPIFQYYRYKVLVGGRGGLKSWTVARRLLLEASSNPYRYLCAREVQNSIKESVHQLLADQIQELQLGSLFTVMTDEIRGNVLPSKFIYTGLSKQTKESIKSYERVNRVWVEEANNVSKRSWDILLPTIRVPGSEIYITFNPDMDTDETYVRFVLQPPKEAIVIHLNWRDNPWFTPELEMERQATLLRSKDDYENIWEGKPRTATPGAIYAREVTDLVAGGRYCPVPYDPRLKVHTVWDLGWNDKTTIHLVQSDLSAIRIVGYLEGNHLRPDQWAQLLSAMPLNWGWDWLPHDGYHVIMQTGLSTYDVLRKAGRKVRGPQDSVPTPLQITEANGMRVLRQTFPRIYLHNGNGQELLPPQYREQPEAAFPGLTHWSTSRLLECWKRFRYNVPRHGEPQLPVHDEYKHGCDGSRYLALVAPRLSNEEEGERFRPVTFGGSQDLGMGALG